MIKVLKHGNPTKYIADCDECGAQLEFNKRDTQSIKGYAPITYIICPECGHYITKEYFREKKINNYD